MRNLSVVLLVIALLAILSESCDGGESPQPPAASEELRTRIAEALAPEGKVFHARLSSASSEEPPPTEVMELWLDAPNRRERGETPDPPEGSDSVWVRAEGRRWSYNPWSDSVDTSERYPDELAEEDFLLPYAQMLAAADESEWRVLDEMPAGGRHFLLEIEWMPGTADEDHAAEAGLLITVELDKKTLLPVRESWSSIEPDGEERLIGTSEYEFTEYLSPNEVPSDLFSPESVYGLVGSQ